MKYTEDMNQVKNNVKDTKHPKFVRWALLLGIIVVLNIFFVVVQQIVFPVPSFTKYCPRPDVKAVSKSMCDKQSGVWSEYPTPNKDVYGTETPNKVSGYCDYYTKCQASYENVRKEQHLYSFMLMTVLGTIALVIGLVPIGASIVSSGISYGGVLALVIGSMQYWGDAGSWLRLGISAIALALLIWVGIRRFRDTV